MSSAPGWVYAAIAAAAGVAASLLAFSLRANRLARKRKQFPKHWPLQSRVIVNTEECRVWGWLAKVFYDHHVMIKMPVTRFTLPHSAASGEHWHELLSGVYCTFTICAGDGRVVGCVDVPRKGGFSRSNRQLKQSLLSECGMAYCVVNSDCFPAMAEIRTEFLGELALMPKGAKNDDHSVAAVRDKLRQSIERQRHNRISELGALMEDHRPEPADEGKSTSFDSDFGMDAWQTNNSFISPLDSRTATLR